MNESVSSRDQDTAAAGARGFGSPGAGGIRRARAGLRWVEDILAVGSGLFAVAIMVATTRDALGRYLFNAPMRGTFETVERLFMVGLVFFAAARTERIGRNVSVRLLINRVSTRAGAALRLVPALGAALLWGYLAWKSWDRGLERMDTLVTTTMRPMPRGLPWLVSAVGLAFLSLRIFVNALGEIIAPKEFEELAVAQKQVAE